VIGAAVFTVRGKFAPSLQLARTPGVLTARYVAMFELYVAEVQLMPPSVMFDAPRVTVAHMGARDACVVPFAQYPNESEVAVPDGTYVKVPFALSVTVPLAAILVVSI
jgi:hypothetical protein